MDDFAGKPTTIPFLAAKLRRWLPPLSGIDEPPTAAPELGVDRELLEALAGGDPGLAADLLQDFVDSSEADLQALSDAIAARRHDEVHRHAHRLKGASRIVGAHVLSDLAQQLEHRAAHDPEDWTGLGELVARAGEQLTAIAAGVR